MFHVFVYQKCQFKVSKVAFLTFQFHYWIIFFNFKNATFDTLNGHFWLTKKWNFENFWLRFICHQFRLDWIILKNSFFNFFVITYYCLDNLLVQDFDYWEVDHVKRQNSSVVCIQSRWKVQLHAKINTCSMYCYFLFDFKSHYEKWERI